MPTGLEPAIPVLQTSALPLGHGIYIVENDPSLTKAECLNELNNSSKQGSHRSNLYSLISPRADPYPPTYVTPKSPAYNLKSPPSQIKTHVFPHLLQTMSSVISFSIVSFTVLIILKAFRGT